MFYPRGLARSFCILHSFTPLRDDLLSCSHHRIFFLPVRRSTPDERFTGREEDAARGRGVDLKSRTRMTIQLNKGSQRDGMGKKKHGPLTLTGYLYTKR